MAWYASSEQHSSTAAQQHRPIQLTPTPSLLALLTDRSIVVCGHQDGAHFADAGPSVFMDCPGGQDHPTNKSDCAGWLGSGSVWKKLPAKRDEGKEEEEDDDDEWIMNYSQQYNCGGGGCQSIFFSTSKDLVNWTPVAPDSEINGGLVFKCEFSNGLPAPSFSATTLSIV